jgi:hypothetical protein
LYASHRRKVHLEDFAAFELGLSIFADLQAKGDDKLFGNVVTELIRRARPDCRRVRAFGEIVARYGKGMIKRLPFDSNIRGIQICESQAFPFLDAYPKTGITEAKGQAKSVQHTLELFDQAITCGYAAFFRPFTFVHLAR